MLKNAIRWCADIGMFALDLPKVTCRHRTAFCNAHCYNVKIYNMFKAAMPARDAKNWAAWLAATAGDFAEFFSAKRRRQTARFRFATRGEVLSVPQDVFKVAEIAKASPAVLFWIPTRAWRNAGMRELVQSVLFPLPNIRLCASLDPTNTAEENASLKSDGWSTLFFGDNTATDGRMLCPKTWEHTKGACATCERGCFSAARTDVHLKQH